MYEQGIDFVLQISCGSSSSSARVRLSSVSVLDVTALDGMQYEIAFSSKETGSFTGSFYVCDTTSIYLLYLYILIPDNRDTICC